MESLALTADNLMHMLSGGTELFFTKWVNIVLPINSLSPWLSHSVHAFACHFAKLTTTKRTFNQNCLLVICVVPASRLPVKPVRNKLIWCAMGFLIQRVRPFLLEIDARIFRICNRG